MKKHIELLAPGGDIDSIKAAILAGADAIYCGLDKFNARNRAVNISIDDLHGILRLAHEHNCQVFITLNIIIVDSEFPSMMNLLNKLVNTSIDGVIIQDLGMFYIINKYFKGLKIHASTQLTTHNEGQIHFHNKLNATRVNLSRELSLTEISALATIAHKTNMLIEVFVHGSNCLCFSGACYMSSVHGGNSGNRGRCSQPCRDQYVKTSMGKDFPLNLKDNSAYTNLRELYNAGVDSVKIEGRIKKFHYVYTVVDAWRKQLNNFYHQNDVNKENSQLYTVFNRDFSNAFLVGKIHKDMFIDNPRDNSAIHLASKTNNLEQAKADIYDQRTEIIESIDEKIKQLHISKTPINITFSGNHDIPLKVVVSTPKASFDVFSETNLENNGKQILDEEFLFERFKSINDTEYAIGNFDIKNLQKGLFLPFKDISNIKKRILFVLNGNREMIEPVEMPILQKTVCKTKPTLSVLISSVNEIFICTQTSANVYFQLPNSFANEIAYFLDIFQNNNQLTPWFPSILIGDDYAAAVEFLNKLSPKSIVTDNTGIAFEASKTGISWIAGPFFNTVNSFSIVCLKENFNCVGAFISNEISKVQLKGIKNPNDFQLFYSIYHPIVLMTSRQCLFHQVIRCHNNEMNESCVTDCEKSTTIAKQNDTTFIIEKSKQNYHRIYNEINYLNTNVINDFPNLFSSFLIDLRDIKTKTNILNDKLQIISHFEKLISGNQISAVETHQIIHPTTNIQYKKGI